ncbi:MAG: type III-A CRISPR-associated protein Csm2 [Methanophagales archaeon]|nr:type III-A CRISPR-associated protein Csm2 [Methanophagales archaeon]MCW3137034.1 type III-A CRISPR-associated protein Csm2 [Methanophagales archaeon]MCW3139993.1 type III-A CRISPR-associated protein Csm2 [Methanophagales archaeon]MCW7069805.1 type III-A CRISPR-associated protein Csm2 [Methanophagales archaeon]
MDRRNIVEKIKKDLPDILAGDSKKLVEDAKDLGELLGKEKREGGTGMTTSQIRNIFSEVKKMEFDKYKIDLLRPKLAYTAGRHREVLPLQEVLDKAIKEIDDDEGKFDRFKDFFEAIVAYHRKWGKD